MQKLVRECVRPFRQASARITGNGSANANRRSLADFHPLDCTVEPEGLNLLKSLVTESHAYPGPIIEIGTLVGATASHMAAAKAPHQKIITVDNYCWNPWNLDPDVQYDLARLVLSYLRETGAVEMVRSDKNEYFAQYDGPAPAMVFLDAIHDYEETKKDIEWAQRVGAKIISGHDYSRKFPGVMQIVDECGGPRRLEGTVWAL